jgi:8-oxo-dGTP pyrophosphatase MutT (NUDIX family)
MAPALRREPDAGVPLRPAAALLLIYPRAGDWFVPLTVRGATLRHHTGQVSLPGGRLDHPGESIEHAALRETFEEIGVAPSAIELLGRLTPLPIAVSGHLLHPVVGAAAGRPVFALHPDEVARLIELPIAHLLRPDAIARDVLIRSTPPTMANVPYFEFDGARIWGATAMVLAELVALLEGIEL